MAVDRLTLDEAASLLGCKGELPDQLDFHETLTLASHGQDQERAKFFKERLIDDTWAGKLPVTKSGKNKGHFNPMVRGWYNLTDDEINSIATYGRKELYGRRVFYCYEFNTDEWNAFKVHQHSNRAKWPCINWHYQRADLAQWLKATGIIPNDLLSAWLELGSGNDQAQADTHPKPAKPKLTPPKPIERERSDGLLVVRSAMIQLQEETGLNPTTKQVTVYLFDNRDTTGLVKKVDHKERMIYLSNKEKLDSEQIRQRFKRLKNW